MKTTIQLTALTLAIVIGGVTDASARKGPGMSDISFETLDTDGNGELTQAEMEAHRAARFATLDADGDGAVTVEELEAHMATKAGRNAARMMDRLDKDEDGKLTEAEMQPRKRRDGSKMFSRLDSDGNGSLSKEEFEAAKSKMGKHRKHRKGSDGE